MIRLEVHHSFLAFSAVLCHKLVVTFCVGLELATGGGAASEISGGHYMAYMGAYATAAPLGVAIGILASEGLAAATGATGAAAGDGFGSGG